MADRDHLQGSQMATRRMRRDSGPGGLLIGYEDLTGTPKPVPGDEKFPFFLSPPDLGVSAMYLQVGAIPPPIAVEGDPIYSQMALDEWAQGSAIDVRGVRLLTFYLTLVSTPVATMNGLGIIPQAAMDLSIGAQDTTTFESYQGSRVNGDSLRWYSIGVVDAVSRGAFPTVATPATAMVAPSYSFRYAHGSQFVVPFTDVVPGPANLRTGVNLTLVFDVTAYQWFRLIYNGVFIAPPDGVSYVFPPSTDTSPRSDETDTLAIYYQVAR